VALTHVLKMLALLSLNNEPPIQQYVSIMFVHTDAEVFKAATRYHEHTTGSAHFLTTSLLSITSTAI
jgi:hypothetical protein